MLDYASPLFKITKVYLYSLTIAKLTSNFFTEFYKDVPGFKSGDQNSFLITLSFEPVVEVLYKLEKMTDRYLSKELFRTCNFLPFSCTHLALWRGKGQGKRPKVHAKQKGFKNFFIVNIILNINFLTRIRSVMRVCCSWNRRICSCYRISRGRRPRM